MKKFFFFRSSATSNCSSNVVPPTTDHASNSEHFSESGRVNRIERSSRNSSHSMSKSRKQTNDVKICTEGPGLRRSRSLSSAAFLGPGKQINSSGLGDRSRSPSNVRTGSSHQPHSSRCRILTPERQYKAKQFEMSNTQYSSGLERPRSSASSRIHQDSSGNSSTSSSNVSTKILDRYVDGEQHQEMRPEISSHRHYPVNGDGSRWQPPRIQHTAPTSPTNSIKDKPKSHSFCFSPGECAESGIGPESPRSLAKNVIERLSQSHFIPQTISKEFDNDMPITIGDIYSRSSKRNNNSSSDVAVRKRNPVEETYETINGYHPNGSSGFQKQSTKVDFEGLTTVGTEEVVDEELQIRAKEAEDRVMLYSEELEQESFLRESGINVPSLVQTIRNMAKERISLALEVLSLLQSQISERASVKEELRMEKAVLESQTRRLEKEKNELQSGLEKELDRRSSDWSLKLEKYQSEEHRLRERVRELAEQNVSLQREVSSFSAREAESRNTITNSEQKVTELSLTVDKIRKENQDLNRILSELQEKYRAAKEERDCIERNFQGKEKECKELQKSITRLIRTCGEQEKTIDGLRERLSDEFWKSQPAEKFNKHVAKLQMEHIRLTGVESALRRELESYRVEVDSLRHENINILTRLKDSGKENGAFTFKLDKEMSMRISYLQHQGLSLLDESSQLCSKLLEFVREKPPHLSEANQEMEVVTSSLDGQFVIDSEIKVQGLKRGTESLKRSLQLVSTLLHEKSNLAALKGHSHGKADAVQLNDHSSEEVLKSELKAEALLISLLREKLYSKELEVDQLQAELATAVRGNDILRCEVQNARDNLSCVSHKLKDLELQMLKKDENMNMLQNDLQESTAELSIARGILPKISEDRDLMWEDVKQYSEKNRWLNTEVNQLKKKIEALEEDVLLKEGQITILKDSLKNKPFDLFANGGGDSTEEFLLH